MKSVAKDNALIVEGSLSKRRIILRFRRIIGEIVTHFAIKKSRVAISPMPFLAISDDAVLLRPYHLVAKIAAIAQQEGELSLCHYLH
jgi:hypothetical protein